MPQCSFAGTRYTGGVDDDSALLAAHYRLLQAYDGLVADPVALDGAIAFDCPRFSDLPNACHAGDFVGMPDGATALRELDAYYAPRGARCSRVRIAGGAYRRSMDDAFAAAGFTPRAVVAWRATSAPTTRPSPPHVRVVSARALRRAYSALLSERGGRDVDARMTEYELDRLDNPQFDAWVAEFEGAPCACVALLQVGPIGGLFDLYVRPEFRRRGLGSALVAYALAAARRWALRQVLAGCGEHNAPAQALATRLGFRRDGILPAFCRPEWVEWGA